MKLRAKLIMEGQIKAVTGLSIGGSEANVAIGGIDNNVIKTSEGVPFIPGSSLKGKLRSLLEKKEGKNVCNCGACYICAIFGTGAGNRQPKVGPTRLYVRDSMLNEDTKRKMEDEEGEFSELELNYTEGKWENNIDRKTAKASNPRQTERVPAGARFDFNMVYNILEIDDLDRFKQVIVGLRMLEDDYLGGNGSRGYGRIKFKNFEFKIKTIKEYEGDNQARTLYEGELSELAFADVKQKLETKLGAE